MVGYWYKESHKENWKEKVAIVTAFVVSWISQRELKAKGWISSSSDSSFESHKENWKAMEHAGFVLSSSEESHKENWKWSFMNSSTIPYLGISQRELKESNSFRNSKWCYFGISQRELKGDSAKGTVHDLFREESHKENWKLCCILLSFPVLLESHKENWKWIRGHIRLLSAILWNLTKRIESHNKSHQITSSGENLTKRIESHYLLLLYYNFDARISQRELKVGDLQTRARSTRHMNLTKRIESTAATLDLGIKPVSGNLTKRIERVDYLNPLRFSEQRNLTKRIERNRKAGEVWFNSDIRNLTKRIESQMQLLLSPSAMRESHKENWKWISLGWPDGRQAGESHKENWKSVSIWTLSFLKIPWISQRELKVLPLPAGAGSLTPGISQRELKDQPQENRKAPPG